MSNKRCIVFHCENRSNCIQAISSYAIPNGGERLIQWLNSCNRTDLLERENNIRTNNKNFRVCNCHFETNMFFTTQRRSLRPNAEPTLLGDIPFKWVKFRCAYLYQPKHPYYDDDDVCIGVMGVICQYCNAMKFKESVGMCCSNGTVRIPNIDEPPVPMKTFLESSTSISEHFLENINKYNNAFHMTSFGAAETIVENYMPTFKIRGQVYHLAGSLMPLPNTNHKYLQVYFMDDEEEQIDARMGICSGLNKDIIRDLQLLLHNINSLITKFKTALDHMPTDQYRLVINANMVPQGQHRGRFNAPSQVEMAVVMIGEEYGNHDIILSRKDEKLQRISETHRSYDSLEYPLIFLHGEDGYAIDILSFNIYVSIICDHIIYYNA